MLIVWHRYELHEWVYQLHTSLDEFKKKQHGVYSIVSNSTTGNSLLTDFKLYPTQHHQEEQNEAQGVYAVVKKPKPTRQAPPVPPRSKEMTIMSDDAPSDSAVESITGGEGDSGVQSRATLMSFGSGSDVNLSHHGRHKRSLSDSFIIGKVNIDMASELPAADHDQASSALKKMSSDTDLSSGRLIENSGFELPKNVKRKKVYKRRKTIATSARKNNSQSPPLEPPPPPPYGDARPEVNQAIIEALYALDEELGQNTALSPKNSTSAVAPAQIDHTTLFASFQSPPESSSSPLSSTTSNMLSPVNTTVDYEPATMSNDDMAHQESNGHASYEDVDFQANKSMPAAKPEADYTFTVTGKPPTDVALKVRKVPPPVKPKPKPKPPQRTTSYNKAVELHGNAHNIFLSSLKKAEASEPKPMPVVDNSTGEKAVTKPVSQAAEVHRQQLVFPPQDSEKMVNGRVLTTFSLDDLSRDTIERNKKRGVLTSTQVPKSTGTTITLYNKSIYPEPKQTTTTVSINHTVSKQYNAPEANNVNQKARVVEQKKQTGVSDKPTAPSATVTTPLTHHVSSSSAAVTTPLTHHVGSSSAAAATTPLTHSSCTAVTTPPTHHVGSPSKTNSSSIAISTIFQSVVGDMLPSSETTLSTSSTTSASTLHNSGSEESMTKLFQNWPRSSTPSPDKSPATEPSKWKDSQAHQHIYDDPWDRKMMGNQSSQSSLRGAGDWNSLERRSGGSSTQLQLSSSGRMKAGDRNSLERRTAITTAGPRRGTSIENLFKKTANTTSTENLNAGLKKKGASTENLSKMDPTSPLYLYKKALRNHEQQMQQQQEKEKSYTLPLKGDKFANVLTKTMGDKRLSQQSLPTQSSQLALRPRANTSNNISPSRAFQSMQNVNGDRKMSMPPQPQQYPQHTPSQQPRRAVSNVGHYPKNNPGYKPYVLNTNGRPPSSIDHNPANLSRRDSNKSRPPFVGNPHMPPNRRQDDWRYVKPGTQMTYDRDSDSTILRSLV